MITLFMSFLNQERMKHPTTSSIEETTNHTTVDLDFSRILSGDAEKRRNPFSK